MSNPNPNTSGLKPPWKKGKSANPGGKTSAQRKLEIKNAERATRIRAKMLESLEDALSDDESGVPLVEALDAIVSDNLRLIKDSEERGFGAPRQEVENTGKVTLQIDPVQELENALAKKAERASDAS